MLCMYTMYCMYTIMCICTIYIYISICWSICPCVCTLGVYYVCMQGMYLCMCTIYIFTMHTKYMYTTKFDHPSIYPTARPVSCLPSRLFICVSTCTFWIYYVCILSMYQCLICCIYAAYVYGVCAV